MLLAVALVALLPGCSAIQGVTGGQRTTVTPAPVTPTPTATPTAASTVGFAGDLPPGVAPDGSVDVARLRRAHLRVVAGRAFRRESRYFTSGWRDFFRPSNGTVLVANASTYRRRTFGAENRTVYADPTGRYVRSWYGPDVSTRVEPPAERNATRAFGRPALLRFVGGSAALSLVERDGTRYVRLFVSERPGSVLGGSTEVRNYTATAYVRPDGFVRAVHVEYDVQSGNRTIHLSRRVAYRLVAADAVTVPDWAAALKGNGSAAGTAD